MKQIIKILLPLLVLISASFASHAGKHDYFKKIDSDNNQVVNKAEFAVHMQKYFTKQAITDKSIQQKKIDYGFNRRDSNSDGQLTFAEFSAKK